MMADAATGWDIVMTGYAGEYGAALLARKHSLKLCDRFSTAFLRRLIDSDIDEIERQAVAASDIADTLGVVHRYAVGDGGIFGALWMLGVEVDMGLVAELSSIPIRQDIIEVCDYIGVNPYLILSKGCMVMAVKHGQILCEAFGVEGIRAETIGYISGDNSRTVRYDNENRFLEPYIPGKGYVRIPDEIYKI